MAKIAYPLAKPVEVLQAVICAILVLHQGNLVVTGIGCRSECARDYIIARSDYIFVKDRRIKSNISYFESTTFSNHTPFQFVQDSVNKMLSITFSSNNYVESLIFSERMSLQFTNTQSLKFIRLRITFYIQEFLTDNEIQILLDDYIQGEIIKATTFNKVTKIKSSSTNCSNYD
ncbi:unnamed protein product [Paramecium sonneborni]|uniref:Uncharacterized protein n=1 Tax=Paramecium sonneborni TaxID=65129 RepID=A0A8S1MXZ4_9CILI|nr:unnamed protein product [Paramecium sonneborni]